MSMPVLNQRYTWNLPWHGMYQPLVHTWYMQGISQVYTLIVICHVPRIYLGYIFPSHFVFTRYIPGIYIYKDILAIRHAAESRLEHWFSQDEIRNQEAVYPIWSAQCQASKSSNYGTNKPRTHCRMQLDHVQHKNQAMKVDRLALNLPLIAQSHIKNPVIPFEEAATCLFRFLPACRAGQMILALAVLVKIFW